MMERETFFSGYCRCIDGSRTVAVEAEDSELTFVDCDYETCPYAANCPIGKNITAFLMQNA